MDYRQATSAVDILITVSLYGAKPLMGFGIEPLLEAEGLVEIYDGQVAPTEIGRKIGLAMKNSFNKNSGFQQRIIYAFQDKECLAILKLLAEKKTLV